MGDFETIITYILALVGGGGLVKILENARLNKADDRQNEHNIIDQLQEQMREDRQNYKIELDSIRKELIEMRVEMTKLNMEKTEAEREKVRLEIENGYLRKEYERDICILEGKIEMLEKENAILKGVDC